MSVHFADLPALQALVTDDFGAFGPALEVTQEMITNFAKLTGDEQWIHVDVERAKREGPFGGTIAHGFLILSLLTKLTDGIDAQEGGAAISGFGSVINYGADKLRFVSPVLAGSFIHARRRISHVRKKGPDGTQITFDAEVWVKEGKRPAMSYRSLALFLP